MICRCISLSLIIFLTSNVQAAPLPKDPAKGMPHLVWQVKPIAGITDDLHYLKAKLKDVKFFWESDEAQKLVGALFPEWQKGIDASQPLGGYLTVVDDLEKSRPVFLIPVKEKTAFIEMMKEFCANELGEVEDKPGMYKGSFKFIFSKTELAFRLKDDYAYLSFIEFDAIDDVKRLPKPADLLLKDETALVAVRLYLEGVSTEAKKSMREALEKFSHEGRVGIPEMMLMGMLGASDSKDFVNRMKSALDEAKWAALRVDFDRKADTFGAEFNLVPRKESALGKEIAAFKPKPSRLAGLLDNQTAAGILVGYGNFGGLKIDPNSMDEFVKETLEGVGLGGSDVARGLMVKALANSIRVNEVDAAMAFKQAPSKETYTLVVAAKLNQPKLLAAAMFGYLQTLPKEKRDAFKFNALKLDGDIAVHQLKLTDLPDEAKKVFGESDLYFCLKDELMFAAIGIGAVDRLKEAIKVEAKEGAQFLIQVNHAKLKPLIKVIDPDQAERWAKLFPKEEDARLLHGKVEGGEVLRVRYTTDAIPLFKMLLGEK